VAFRALLVANWDYSDKGAVLQPLNGPRNDLRAMVGALTHPEYGLFRAEDVEQAENLPWDQLRITFLKFLKKAGRDDRLLLYFSGHGERLSGEQLALCGVDTDSELLDATSFDTANLRGWIEDYNRAAATIVILDCCYAGQMKGGAPSADMLVRSLGSGTMLLASGGNEPTRDAAAGDNPSPFTAALTRILTDPEVTADQDDLLTADQVYSLLERHEPPLLPRPHRNVRSQGTFALARRRLPTVPTRPDLEGFAEPEIETVDLAFGSGVVTARWAGGETDTFELAALDGFRQSAVRRLSQLADAIIRLPDYSRDPWWQQTAQRTWNSVGSNLLETALPPNLRERVRRGIDGPGRRLLKVRLSFAAESELLETYPWEYLQLGPPPGSGYVAVSPSEREAPAPALPLALRAGLLIERVVSARQRGGEPRRPGAVPTVSIVNCLPGEFGAAAGRIADGLTRMAELNVVPDLRGRDATWPGFLDVFIRPPRLLLLFAPVRRRGRIAQVGFAKGDGQGEADWRQHDELVEAVRDPGRAFDAVVFCTFAAEPGEDSFRSTFQLARELARAGTGPVVFTCHWRGYEALVPPFGRDTFPVLLIDALTRDIPLDQAVYYAKNRLRQRGDADLRRTFGVPGYYVAASAPPSQMGREPIAPSTVGRAARGADQPPGGQRTEGGR
jgi:hypothetical protein